MSKIGQFVVLNNLKRYQSTILACFILVAAFALYFQSLQFDFLINFQDDSILLNHPELRKFSLENLKIILSNSLEGNYFFITAISYLIDGHFFDVDPFYYHLHSVILFLLNGILVYVLVKRLGFQSIAAIISLLLFLTHPLIVENVVWIASRDSLVGGIFFIIALISYLNYAKHGSFKNYFFLASAVAFALLSSSFAIVLPFLFMLFSWYKEKDTFKRNLIPLMVLSVICFTVGGFNLSHQFYSPNELVGGFNALDRMVFLSYSIFYYLSSFIYPVHLSPKEMLPLKVDGVLPAIYYASLLVNFALLSIAIVIRKYKSKRVVYLSLAFSLLCLSPSFLSAFNSNEIVSNGNALLGYIGLYILVAYYLSKLNIGFILAIILSGFWAFQSFQYQKIFENSSTVWSYIIDSNEDNPIGKSMALNERGQVKLKKGDQGGALIDFNSALKLYPEFELALMNRAVLNDQVNQPTKALKDLNKVLSLNENNIDALKLRGMVYGKANKATDGISDLNRALQLDSLRSDLFVNRGILFSINKEYDLAILDFDEAIRISPDDIGVYINRGKLYFEMGEYEKAKSDFLFVYSKNENIYRSNYLLAKTYFLLENKEKGIEILNNYSGNQAFSAQIAKDLLSDGYAKESIPFFTIAMGDPDLRDRSLYQRSKAFAMLKDYQNALDDLFAILENVPNPTFFYEIGNYYKELEKSEKACEFWGEASKRNLAAADKKIANFCN